MVYGAGEKEILLQIQEQDFKKVFREAGESSLVELEVGQDRKNVLIHDVAFDPVKDRPIHVDFLQVRMDKSIRVKVPLVFGGESPAVKNLGGVLVKVMHELEIEALPKDLPHEIKVDTSRLINLEDRFTVADLKLSREVKVMAQRDEVLALAATPRAEEEVSVEAAPSLESIEVVGKKKEKAEEAAQAPAEETKESKKPARPRQNDSVGPAAGEAGGK